MGLELKKTILKHALQTVDWIGDEVVDWAKAGSTYSSSGKTGQLQTYHFGYHFDSAISTGDGQYVFLFERLGTKGLLLKDGEILREMNRSYYKADAYEYPACFVRHNKTTYLVHCPDRYDTLEFEEVDSGKVVTRRTRVPLSSDSFHSRLQVSPDGKRLLSRGWIWHPVDIVQEFVIADCLSQPKLLDKVDFERPKTGKEINTACFIDGENVLLGTAGEEELDDVAPEVMPPKSLLVWNLGDNSLSRPVMPEAEFGNLTVIDGNLAWDTYAYPKIIDYRNGEIVAACKEIDSGKQRSSIIGFQEKPPPMAFSANRRRLAIAGEASLAILALD